MSVMQEGIEMTDFQTKVHALPLRIKWRRK